MALTVKQLSLGQVSNNTYTTASSNEIYLVPTGKSVVVSNLTFVNNGGGLQNLTLSVLRSGVAVGSRVRLGYAHQMATSGETGRYVLKDQITLGAGDRLLADCTTNNAVEFVVSGVERDV